MNGQFKRVNNRPGKGIVFEVLVSVSLLIVFVMVIVTGILSHQRLNHIIDTVKTGTRPDSKLILVKEINNNLSEAENSVKSFSLTRSGDYMVRFYELTENTGEKFDELRTMVPPNDDMAPYVDTLSRLVGEKFRLLDRLLSIMDEFRVQQAMQQVEESIRDQEIKEAVPVPGSSAVGADTIIEGADKKDNFFSRFFKRKNKKEDASPDTVNPAEIQVSRGPSIEEISEQVDKVRKEVVSRDLQLRNEEWTLLQQDKLIMEQIRKLLSFMEEKEKANLQIHTREAELKAGETQMIIMAFGVTASVFILLAALVIYIYIKRSNEYKSVLEQARKEAEALAKAKELFLANMSHEIRTPMNIISGFLSQILKGPMYPEQQEQLQIVKQSSDHLLHLLNELLDLSRLQADKLELVETRFSPAELILEIHRALEPTAEEKKLQLLVTADPALPAVVYGDPVRIRQILLNLAGNAIKFTDGGNVSISAFPLEQDQEKTVIVFEVSDTGIGITESDREKIFGEFEKGHASAGKNSDGAGLGLAITRKLVNLLKGTISFESQPLKGSVFRVEIPFQNRGGNNRGLPVNRDGIIMQFKDLRLLVVDDDQFNRRLARVILEKYGCQVTEAGSAEEAIELVNKTAFDLVLMDIHLPGIKGPEAAAEIKRIGLKAGKVIPVIALSAAISMGDPEKFRQSGLDDFILKPYEEDRLMQVIAQFTGIKPSQNPAGPGGPDYDLGPLKISSDGSDSFFQEMIHLFLQGTDEGLTMLSEHIEHQEWELASGLAHKLISPCRHLKAGRLSHLLKRIENIPDDPAQIISAEETARQARVEFELIRDDIRLKLE